MPNPLRTPEPAPLRRVRLSPPTPAIERRADGSLIVRAQEPLPAYHANLIEPLRKWAGAAPDRTFLAARGADGQWHTLTKTQVYDTVQRIGAALQHHNQTPKRPNADQSGNDIEQALLGLGATLV